MLLDHDPDISTRPAGRSNLAVCAIFRNESAYLEEWLTYHSLIGVDHFYLYDNNSTDASATICRNWDRTSSVTLIDWPHAGGQIGAYRHALETFRSQADWCAFIDIDEFLVMQQDVSLPAFLGSLPPLVTGLFVHWFFFGSNGHHARTDGLVAERFTRRGHAGFYTHHCGKSIVRLSETGGSAGIHIVPTAGFMLDDAGNFIDQNSAGHTHFISHNTVALNHYFTKSKEEWTQRRSLGKADKIEHEADFRRTEQEFYDHDVNDVVDLRHHSFAQAVRATMTERAVAGSSRGDG